MVARCALETDEIDSMKRSLEPSLPFTSLARPFFPAALLRCHREGSRWIRTTPILSKRGGVETELPEKFPSHFIWEPSSLS